MSRTVALGLVIAALGGCPKAAGPGPYPAVVASGERLMVPGAAVALYAYPDTIVAYPVEDRGAYEVRLAAGPDGDRVRAEWGGRLDDLVDDGYAVRLGADERTRLAATAGVIAVVPLQPAQRRSTRAPVVTEGQADVRLDLFADVSTDEGAAVAAWIEWRGGAVTWRGRAALTARLAVDDIAAAARLSPVRWVE